MEGRSFDNSGIMEDIATESAAGPIGASLYKNEIAGYSSTINQGSYLERPSKLHVKVNEVKGKITVQLTGDVSYFSKGKINL